LRFLPTNVDDDDNVGLDVGSTKVSGTLVVIALLGFSVEDVL
jgi:hypothetical protein